MSRRATNARRQRRTAVAPAAPRGPSRALLRWTIVGVGVLVAALFAAARLVPEPKANLRYRADTAAREGRWEDALRLWGEVNATALADAVSWRGEAKAALALGRAARAERALEAATALDPAAVEPWLIRLERLRMLGRPLEAMALGKTAYAAVPAAARPAVLRAWTLALLSDAPDDLARATLSRWLAADPDDIDAIAALDRRYAEYPQAGDPARAGRIARLERALERHPDHVPTREALAVALAEDGRPKEGRAVIDAWPEAARDARYDRLDGRWALEYEGDPARAVTALRRAVKALPSDRRSRYRLARALQAAGQVEAARAEAREVSRLHEALEPVRLGRRLDEALDGDGLDAAEARELAALCRSAGLGGLADLWEMEARRVGAADPG